jgi:ABC-type histidine transport system ATPase subunit
MDAGTVNDRGAPQYLFGTGAHPRVRDFLGKVL